VLVVTTPVSCWKGVKRFCSSIRCGGIEKKLINGLENGLVNELDLASIIPIVELLPSLDPAVFLFPLV
jgi:hypothetical protein